MKWGFLFPDCRGPQPDGISHRRDLTYRCARSDALGVDAEGARRASFRRGLRLVDPISFDPGALATSTRHSKIGFAVVQTALHHPIRLAEQLAILDNITKGRS